MAKMAAQRRVGARGKGGRSARPPARRELEASFREFGRVASDFTRSLEGRVDRRSASLDAPRTGKRTPVPHGLFGKWTLDILELLSSGRALGFGELRSDLRTISSRVLSSKLHRLEADGLVYREVLPTRPPRASYGLTERGMTVARLGEPMLLFLRYGGNLYVHERATPARAPLPTPPAPGRR
ncbi:transcriptional regulator, MarR family [mine drainage metagenome]|uniref:Transcriptional regulator, MarR family n=1 Tax=mine drainage metagenome TaxID=410659 RepID=T0ZVI3_9ZZZZ